MDTQETWNALDEVPIGIILECERFKFNAMYDVVIDFQDETGATIIVGTEYGAFISDNGGDDWSIANLGMAATAEFSCSNLRSKATMERRN